MPATKGETGENAGSFISWTQVTTWHGMYDLFSTKNRLSRCLWIFVMVFTTYMFMLQVTQLILNFVTSSKWATNAYDESPDNGVTFPNVTICNFNLVSEERMRKLNMSATLVEYIMEGMAPFSNEMKWVPDNDTRDHFGKVMREEYYAFVGRDDYIDYGQWLRLLSPTCEQTIKQCSMGKGNKRQVFDCCSSATEAFFGDYGLCFVLHVPNNVSTDVVQDQAGTVNGMTLHLNPDLENYAPLNVQTNQDAGFLLALGYEPEYYLITTPVALRPGSHSWLAVTAMEDRTIFYGNGRPILYDILAKGNPLAMFDAAIPCDPNAKLDIMTGPYLYETCIEDCITKQIVKMCGCAPLNPIQDQFKICDPPTSQGCASDFWLNMTAETAALHQDASNCIENCSQPCARRYVTVRNSATLWPAPKHIKTVQKQLAVTEGTMPTEENVRNRVLVDIFFESTQIHVSEMSEQSTIVGLVSNIGGNLGVWAGISIVTLYQALVWLTHLTVISIQERIIVMRKLALNRATAPNKAFSVARNLAHDRKHDYCHRIPQPPSIYRHTI